jgi:hypothetical protein
MMQCNKYIYNPDRITAHKVRPRGRPRVVTETISRNFTKFRHVSRNLQKFRKILNQACGSGLDPDSET